MHYSPEYNTSSQPQDCWTFLPVVGDLVLWTLPALMLRAPSWAVAAARGGMRCMREERSNNQSSWLPLKPLPYREQQKVEFSTTDSKIATGSL